MSAPLNDNTPSVTNAPVPHKSSQSKDKGHHHSKHPTRSPDKSRRKEGASGESNSRGDRSKRSGGDGHGTHHHRSGHHHRRHRSPGKARGRTRSVENTLDRHGGRTGRSPTRHHNTQHRSPYRSTHRHRSPYGRHSPYRSRQRSPYRHHSPYQSRQRSPYGQQRSHSYDPYRNHSPDRQRGRDQSPDRQRGQNQSLDRPRGREPERSTWGFAPVLRKPPAREPSPFQEDSILREPPALERLNREATMLREPKEERQYWDDNLLLRASTMERDNRGDSLLSAAAQAQRWETLPRVRNPESDSAFKKYSSLLRGQSSENMERELYPRGEFPDTRYRPRNLGQDISLVRNLREPEDDGDVEEEDVEGAAGPRLNEYYSTLKSNTTRAYKALPEPKRSGYKENPKDLSI